MEPIHIVGAIFIAYIVIKEVFVMVKGDTKQIAKDMAILRESLLTKGADNKTPVEQIADIYTHSLSSCVEIEKVLDYVEDLHKWHDKEDDDGVKIWYVRKSLEQSIKKLPITMKKQRELMDSMMKLFDKIQADMCIVKEHFGDSDKEQD
ncbi:MAG: hypothetical protein KAS32_02205 [Candidatus Peribacteraceae bacterium]|nr:hypothetical protein [Candidatus Peribacteraceae bacterium]